MDLEFNIIFSSTVAVQTVGLATQTWNGVKRKRKGKGTGDPRNDDDDGAMRGIL